MTYCSYIIHIESCSLLNKILRQLPSYRRENYSDLGCWRSVGHGAAMAARRGERRLDASREGKWRSNQAP